MSRPVLAALLLLCSPVAVVAQGDAPAASQQDPQAAYNDLARAFGKAMNEWFEARQKAIEKIEAEGGTLPREFAVPPTREFVATAQELAGKHAGTDDAVRFLAFVVKNASNERSAVKKAIETLAAAHGRSEAIADVLGHLRNAPRFGATKQAMALLDDVVTNHPDAECKVQALLTRGTMRLEAGDQAGGVADLRKVKELSKDEDIVAAADEGLFEVEKLGVGCAAPEIEGVDVEGVAFKLSDYRGKVVLLDFWGFW